MLDRISVELKSEFTFHLMLITFCKGTRRASSFRRINPDISIFMHFNVNFMYLLSVICAVQHNALLSFSFATYVAPLLISNRDIDNGDFSSLAVDLFEIEAQFQLRVLFFISFTFALCLNGCAYLCVCWVRENRLLFITFRLMRNL